MRVRTEIALAIGALLVIQVLTSFGAIALLGRMTPAIAQIRGENLYSIEAAERMLEALLESASDPGPAHAAFEAAFERARANVTEAEEEPHLAELARVRDAALAGDPEARRAAAIAIRGLTRANYASTERADGRAQRLGAGGAWAAVVLAAAGFVLSVVAVRRLSFRIVLPLHDLHATALALRAGDPFRRSRLPDSPEEFRTIAEALDELIDAELAARNRSPHAPASREELLRGALLHSLDADPAPRALVDGEGRVVLASRTALELLGGAAGDAWGAALRALPQDAARAAAAGVTAEPLDGRGFLCALAPPAPPSEG